MTAGGRANAPRAVAPSCCCSLVRKKGGCAQRRPHVKESHAAIMRAGITRPLERRSRTRSATETEGQAARIILSRGKSYIKCEKFPLFFLLFLLLVLRLLLSPTTTAFLARNPPSIPRDRESVSSGQICGSLPDLVPLIKRDFIRTT